MTLTEAAHDLYEVFGIARRAGPHPYVQSIGVGADSIKVMLRREPMGHEPAIPAEWHGWKVEMRVVGDLRLCGGRGQ